MRKQKIAANARSVPLRVGKAPQKTKVPSGKPDKFTYALSAYMIERRASGWFVARSVPSITGEKAKWSGPFETVETVCLSAARHQAVELADRHTRSVEAHGIGRDDPLYGLKPTTRLNGKSR